MIVSIKYLRVCVHLLFHVLEYKLFEYTVVIPWYNITLMSSSNRPRAVDFLDKEDGEMREFAEKSEEEPLIVSENDQEPELSVSEAEKMEFFEGGPATNETIEQTKTLPSGAISKGTYLHGLEFIIFT